MRPDRSRAAARPGAARLVLDSFVFGFFVSFVLVSHPASAAAVPTRQGPDRRDELEGKLNSPDPMKRVEGMFELARLGTPDAMRRLLALMDQPPRTLAQFACVAFSQGRDAKALVQVAADGARKPSQRPLVLEALANRTSRVEAAPIALAHLADKDPAVRKLALEVLLAHLPNETPPAIPKLAAGAGDPAVRALALQVWAKLDAEAAAKALEKARSDKAPEVRIGALLALETARQPVPAAFAALADADPRVRLAAIGVLERRRLPDVVPKLIERLGPEKGRMRERVALALEAVTGRRFGESHDSWSRWWANEGASFVAPPVGGGAMPNAAKDEVRNETGVDLPLYHSLPVRSDRVAFLIDVSTSMQEKFTPAGETIATPTTRLVHAADALRDVLKKLPKTARVTVIGFSEEPFRWKNEPVEVDAQRAEEARSFILQPRNTGATNAADALDLVVDSPQIDTVYLLSDGAPAAMPRILPAVRRATRFSGTQVNCIGIGVDAAGEGFLKELARATGGRYVKR